MASLGGFLILMGAGSIILDLFGHEFLLLSWAENWGSGVGWGIRAGFIVVGGAMLAWSRKKQQGD